MAAILRDKTVAERLRIASGMYSSARRMLISACFGPIIQSGMMLPVRGGQEAFAWSSLNSCALSWMPDLRHVVSCLTMRSLFALRAISIAFFPAGGFHGRIGSVCQQQRDDLLA